MTSIEWTEKTWNPIAGCSVVSPGCTNCYAMKQAPRLAANPATPHYAGTVQNSKGGPVWTGKIGIASDSVLTQPLRRKKPTMYFVNSMSDLFHENVPDDVIDRIFAVMDLCPQHTFQVLTKRANRMRQYLTRKAGGGKQDVQNHIAWNVVGEIMRRAGIKWMHEGIDGKWRSRVIQAGVTWPLPNVWLGVSVEDQTRADERIPLLLDTPAAVRFISAEPLLGAIDVARWLRIKWRCSYCKGYFNNATALEVCPDCKKKNGWCGSHKFNARKMPSKMYQAGIGIDWVIVGGESGSNARPMHPDWAQSLRDQCVAAGVPFFFKQWGQWISEIDRDKDDTDWRGNYSKAYTFAYAILNLEGGTGFHGNRVHLMKRTTKAKAGRLLDGRVWDEMPGDKTG